MLGDDFISEQIITDKIRTQRRQVNPSEAKVDEDERLLAFVSRRGGQALDVLKGFGEAGQAAADMSRRQARAKLIQDEMQQVATLQKTPEDALQSIVAAVEPLLAPRAQT